MFKRRPLQSHLSSSSIMTKRSRFSEVSRYLDLSAAHDSDSDESYDTGDEGNVQHFQTNSHSFSFIQLTFWRPSTRLRRKVQVQFQTVIYLHPQRNYMISSNSRIIFESKQCSLQAAQVLSPTSRSITY